MISKNSDGGALSAGFGTAMASPVVSYRCLICADDGTPIPGTIQRVELTLGAGAGEDGVRIGVSYSNSFEARVHDCAADGALSGADVTVRVGVETGDGEYEYVDVGVFTVTYVRTQRRVTVIRGVGFIASKLATSTVDMKYLSSTVATFRNYCYAAYRSSGVHMFMAPPSGAQNDQSHWTNFRVFVFGEARNCRTAAECMALLSGGFAYEMPNGSVTVSGISRKVSCTVPMDTVTEYPTLDESELTVDGLTVVATQEPTDDSDEADRTWVYGTGRVGVSLPWQLNKVGGETNRGELWANAGGVSYRPGQVSVGVLDPRVQVGDRVAVDDDGATAELLVTGIEAVFDGGYFGTIYSGSICGSAEQATSWSSVTDVSGQAVADYDRLANRPKIGGVVLTGDRTLSELGFTDNDTTYDVDVSGGVMSLGIHGESGTGAGSARTWSAAWTAESTAANNVRLTEPLELPSGTYVITLRLPVTDAQDVYTSLYMGGGSDYYAHCGSNGTASWTVTLSRTTTVYAMSAQSSEVAYSYLARGGLTAVRVGYGTRPVRERTDLGVTFAAADGYVLTVADEFADYGMYHAKLYLSRDSAWSASNQKVGVATGLHGAVICNDTIFGSVNSANGNIWCTPRTAYAAGTTLECEVIGFLA